MVTYNEQGVGISLATDAGEDISDTLPLHKCSIFRFETETTTERCRKHNLRKRAVDSFNELQFEIDKILFSNDQSPDVTFGKITDLLYGKSIARLQNKFELIPNWDQLPWLLENEVIIWLIPHYEYAVALGTDEKSVNLAFVKYYGGSVPLAQAKVIVCPDRSALSREIHKLDAKQVDEDKENNAQAHLLTPDSIREFLSTAGLNAFYPHWRMTGRVKHDAQPQSYLDDAIHAFMPAGGLGPVELDQVTDLISKAFQNNRFSQVNELLLQRGEYTGAYRQAWGLDQETGIPKMYIVLVGDTYVLQPSKGYIQLHWGPKQEDLFANDWIPLLIPVNK